MLAARDQENLVHARQTAAAKPLNQGARQFQPRTPGNKIPKTPFRIPVNDENNPLAFGGGKQTVRGPRPGNNENLLRPGKDGLQKQAFVTPLGPRNRAPLGMKTTNAKARVFQTPGPPSNAKPLRTAKQSSVRKLRHAPEPPVVQVEQKQRVEVEEDADRDIEYMPPKPTPLPDHPDDITYDTTFPQFKGRNFARGWESLYADNEVGADGLTKKQREEKKASEEFDRHVDETIRKQLEDMELPGINVREHPDEPCAEEIAEMKLKEMEALKAVSERQIPTLKSRSAAQALALPTRTIQTRSKTGSAPKPRFPNLTSHRPTPPPTNPSSMRHTASVVTSRTTIGYSAGRKVASKMRADDFISPQQYIELYGEPAFGTDMWLRCKAAGCFDTEPHPDDEILAQEAILPPYEEDEDFQLTL